MFTSVAGINLPVLLQLGQCTKTFADRIVISIRLVIVISFLESSFCCSCIKRLCTFSLPERYDVLIYFFLPSFENLSINQLRNFHFTIQRYLPVVVPVLVLVPGVPALDVVFCRVPVPVFVLLLFLLPVPIPVLVLPYSCSRLIYLFSIRESDDFLRPKLQKLSIIPFKGNYCGCVVTLCFLAN